MTLEEIKAFVNTIASQETIAEEGFDEDYGGFCPYDTWDTNTKDAYRGGEYDGAILAYRKIKELFDKLV